MKKLIPIALIFLLAACAKNVNTDAGSWTFHSSTYKATQAYYVLGGLAAYTGNNTPTGSLALWFNHSDTTWPAKAGTYILTNSYPPAPGYAFMQITDSSVCNAWTITGSSTPSITVTSFQDTLIKVNIPPVMVVNINTPPFGSSNVFGKPTGTDSSLVTGTIIQSR